MALGINNGTNVSIEFLTEVISVDSIPELFININTFMFGGFFYFVLMVILAIILYFAANQVMDQPLNNAMYSTATVSVLSFFLRAIFVIRDGTVLSLLTDFQMWVFPIITIMLAMIIWAIKDK